MAVVVKRVNFTPVGGAASASVVTYDNATSGLAAEDVQEAIDEVVLDLASESSSRSSADTTLQTNIDNHIADSSAAHTASAIANVPSGNLVATNLQTAVDELQTDIDTRATSSALSTETTNRTNADTALQTAIDDHIADAISAHAASAISNTPAGSIAATTVQAAINELDGDVTAETARATAAEDAIQDALDNHIAAVPAHSAQNISYDNTFSTLTESEVQGAIDELDAKIEAVIPSTDIPETSFAMANNQSTPADVTGFLLDPFAPMGAVTAIVTVRIFYGEFSSLNEYFDMEIFNTGSDYLISYSNIGDVSGVEFSVTAGGQVQYTSPDIADFVLGSIKFRTFGIAT
jgi:hypothetical protein